MRSTWVHFVGPTFSGRLCRLLWAIGIAVAGCTHSAFEPAPEAGPLDAGRARATALLEIEDRRMSDDVTDEDLADRDVRVRRAATRALARLPRAAATPRLLRALADEDAEVVAWAAYGLGYVCPLSASETDSIVRALTVRAITLAPGPSGVLDPPFAFARALGRCGGVEAEQTLVAWLGPPDARSRAAALALGDLASRTKTLSESAQIALLAAASGGAKTSALPEALYPFGRIDHPLSTVVDRLLEIATAALAVAGPERLYAIRALGRTDRRAKGELLRVVTEAGAFSPAERSEAARALGRLGAAGQRALGEALPLLVPARDFASETTLGTASFGPLLTVLETLRTADSASKRTLYALSSLPVAPNAPATLVRRIARLRCRAASLLTDAAYDEPLLSACDPTERGEIGQRARLDGLARRPIGGRRLAAFRELLASKHLRIREAAIDVLGEHPEVAGASEMLAEALTASEPGVAATAARVVAAHPDRAGTATGPAVLSAFKRGFGTGDVETTCALIEAIGQLRLYAAEQDLARLCTNPNPTLREHAARALTRFGDAKVTCDDSPPYPHAASELGHLLSAPRKVALATDAGAFEIVLDPTLAPVAATRIADLVRDRFFDGLSFHRVVPGFVVQFGDPAGDSFGGADKEPLRCETSPVPFEPLAVGIALAGRDTGSSQIFVALARYPHLDQDYALIGKAVGDFSAAAEGDVIQSATLVP